MADNSVAELDQPWLRGRPVENPDGLKDHYRMSSERISADTVALRVAAESSAAASSLLDEYGHACKDWIDDLDASFLRCHGAVAAPVGSALHDFYDGLIEQASAASGGQTGLTENLRDAASGYDRVDAAGAAAVTAARGGVG